MQRAASSFPDLTIATPEGAASPVPRHVGRILLLIQMLVGYGKDFAATLRQQSVTPQFRLAMQARFGTSEIARILIRIGRALRLAAALETQLRRQAATGQDIQTSAEVALVPPRTRGNRSTTTADRRAAACGTVPDNHDDDLPSDEEIVAMARRGKLGVLIAAICRDLGLVPSVVTEQQWSELADVIRTFGGNFVQLIGDALARVNNFLFEASFTKPLSRAEIRTLNDAVFLRPAPA